MPADLSEFEALSSPKKRTCPLGLALADLSGDEAHKLTAALAADKGIITNAAIIQWLERRGFKGISVGFVSSHRKATCTCNG